MIDQVASLISCFDEQTCWTHLSTLIPGQQVIFQQRPFGPVPLHPMALSIPQPQLLSVLNQDQEQDQDGSKGRPLLLEEQPLLLQDLLDQERQEQQQQKQMQALIRHRATPEAVVPHMGRNSHTEAAAGCGLHFLIFHNY